MIVAGGLPLELAFQGGCRVYLEIVRGSIHMIIYIDLRADCQAFVYIIPDLRFGKKEESFAGHARVGAAMNLP
jgi:hypothetical protein